MMFQTDDALSQNSSTKKRRLLLERNRNFQNQTQSSSMGQIVHNQHIPAHNKMWNLELNRAFIRFLKSSPVYKSDDMKITACPLVSTSLQNLTTKSNSYIHKNKPKVLKTNSQEREKNYNIVNWEYIYIYKPSHHIQMDDRSNCSDQTKVKEKLKKRSFTRHSNATK